MAGFAGDRQKTEPRRGGTGIAGSRGIVRRNGDAVFECQETAVDLSAVHFGSLDARLSTKMNFFDKALRFMKSEDLIVLDLKMEATAVR